MTYYKTLNARGIRYNNNPCLVRQNYALKYAGERWTGDLNYKSFRSLEYGFRAAFAQLRAIQIFHQKEDVRTVVGIMSIMYPDAEDTEKFLCHIELKSRLHKDSEVFYYQRATSVSFVSAIASYLCDRNFPFEIIYASYGLLNKK